MVITPPPEDSSLPPPSQFEQDFSLNALLLGVFLVGYIIWGQYIRRK